MRALSTAALLDAWERGAGHSLLQRALTLLAAACPDTPPERLARLTMGQRDGQLLALRELTFGPRVDAVIRCPRCLATLELAFDASDRGVATSLPENDNGAPAFVVTHGGGQARFRLPDTLDVAAVAAERDLTRARTLLLERCILSIELDGVSISSGQAPRPLLDAVVEHMARVDPGGDVQVMLTCPKREVAFDIASFFWTELDAWATRTLADVHTLAKAYGWRESDILAMSARRRQLYLDLVQS
jgi:hypothetical protein